MEAVLLQAIDHYRALLVIKIEVRRPHANNCPFNTPVSGFRAAGLHSQFTTGAVWCGYILILPLIARGRRGGKGAQPASPTLGEPLGVSTSMDGARYGCIAGSVFARRGTALRRGNRINPPMRPERL